MKIEETTTRECCAPGDLKPYRGRSAFAATDNAKFCGHCGQIHLLCRVTDGLPQPEYHYRPIVVARKGSKA